MKRNTRRRWIGMLSLALIAVTAIVVVLLAPWQSYSTGTVFASTNDDRFTATPYSDVIRFEAEGVATLQVRIFDLSGKELWDSGVVSSWVVDWDRRNDFGERLAYGVYLYSAQGWNASGDVNFQKNGKLALMPGDKVQLQAAPTVSTSNPDPNPFDDAPMTFQPKALGETYICSQLGVGTASPTNPISVVYTGDQEGIRLLNSGYLSLGPNLADRNVKMYSLFSNSAAWDYLIGLSGGTSGHGQLRFVTGSSGSPQPRMVVDKSGRVGIGTTSPSATLEVHGSATNLLALYDSVAPTDPKFRVEKDGDVYADGTYYCVDGAFHVGSADVAERINTSEWVEPGNVVEIDPDHPGFFRKSSSPYSTKVAGIISTSPGVILGNSFEEATNDWEDNRPVLAIAGRVPLQVTAENGPIRIGDLLVSSSIPGVAMRGDSDDCVGAVVGKAMEPLEEGTGVIMMQVMLR